MFPFTAVWARQQTLDLIVTDDLPRRRIDADGPAELHRDVRQDTARGGDVALLDVRRRLRALLPRLEETLHVRAVGDGGVRLKVPLALLLRILVGLDDRA